MSSPLSLEYLLDLMILSSELAASLPFLDSTLSKDEKAEVQSLIQAEMQTMEQKDYLQDLPMPRTVFLDKLSSHSLDSLQVQKREERLLDSKTLLEYQRTRRLNLELMQEYGLDEWNQQNNEDLIHGLRHHKQEVEKKINEINRARKLVQTLASQEICKDYVKTQELIEKNIILEQEIIKLRQTETDVVSSKRVKTD